MNVNNFFLSLQQMLPFALAISANSICQVKFIKEWLGKKFNEKEVLMGVEHAFRETCTYIIPDDVRSMPYLLSLHSKLRSSVYINYHAC